ncbi:hypothetical protein B0J18DRAFT_181285 [Chaetomium sp. MPI-SDFR-AT-0129]|nr:hypothetical protein B0J18DRAFT_181285 [Chaetomium sp. MPI-SDFR-AT-0129]
MAATLNLQTPVVGPAAPSDPASSTYTGALINNNTTKAAEILNITSYRRADRELPVASIHPRQHDAVRATIFRPLTTPSCNNTTADFDFDLGALGQLPFELIAMVCRELDVASALRFSHVNRTAREVLTSVRELRHVGAHALDALCVLLRTGLAVHVPVLDVYAALTTRDCSLCGAAFGGFLFAPTATRCCLACVASSPATRVAHLSRVGEAAGMSAASLDDAGRLPVLHSKKRIVAVQHALALLEGQGKDAEEAEEIVSRWPDSLTLRFQAATTLPYLERTARGEGAAEPGVSCKGCQVAFEADFSDDHLELRDRFYSRAEFLAEHFETCEAAQKLWRASQEGTAPVPEPAWMGLGRTFTAPCARRRPSTSSLSSASSSDY